MQAVILAGGLGTRLRPLTDTIPKVMVKVRGKEFLWYLIAWLAYNGINEIIICAGRLWEVISTSIASYSLPNVTVRLSVENEPLDTAGAVKHAESLLDEDFLLINGDTYLPVSYDTILSHWEGIRRDADCLLVVYTNLDRIAPNDTAVNDEGVVVGYSKQSSEGMKYVNAGLVTIKRSVFRDLPPGVPLSLEQEVFPDLIARRKMAALITQQRYYDIGTPERLKAFEEFLQRHPEVFVEQTRG
jgi:NDP-sugar pyrophosphorylase family protein